MSIKKSFSAIIIFALILQSLTFSFAFADNLDYLFEDSFESEFSNIPGGWYPYAGANITNVKPGTIASKGDKSVNLSNGNNTYSIGIISSTFDVVSGKEYKAIVDLYASSGVGRAYLLIYNTDGVVIASACKDSEKTGEWETLKLDVVAPEYANKAAILLFINEGNKSDVYFDNLTVNIGTDISAAAEDNLAYHRRIETDIKYQNGKWNWQKAVDGNLDTKIEVGSNFTQRSGYMTVDLGALANINRVTLYETGNKINQLKIDVSNDGENWTTVAYQGKIGAKKNIDFPLTQARYVKVNVVDADDTFGFFEIEIFNTGLSATYPSGNPLDAPVSTAPEAEVSPTIPYDSDKFHVYLCIGQSNMVGGDDVLWEDRVRTDGAYLLNSVGEWEYAQSGPQDMAGYNRYATTTISNSDPTLGVAGMSPAQAFAMALAPKMSNDVGIGIICQSVSGTSIDEWQKGAGTNLYESALSRTKEALEKGGVLKGILWAQGEACAARDDYLSLLNTFVTTLRKDLGVEASDVPFIAASYPITRAEQNANIAKIGTVVENSDYISHIGTETFEGVHFTAISQRVRGVRFAEKILKRVYNIEKTEQQLYFETFNEISPVVTESTEIKAEAFTKGTGVSGDPYEVETIGQLYNVKNYPSAHFKQTKNIDESFKECIPEFSGVYDGQGFSINLSLSETDASTASAFIRTLKSGGIVKNLVTKGSVTTAGGAAASIAAVVETTGAYITNCTNYADITGGLRSGGIAGALSKGTTVSGCKNYGKVAGGMYCGGIVATDTLSNVFDCANYGVISGTSHVGGVAGQHNATELKNCFNAGKIISSSDLTGGIAGSIRSGNIVNCYNVGEVTGLKPAAIGTFYVGTTSTIKNCYNVIDIPVYHIYGNISLSNPGENVYQLVGENTSLLTGVTNLSLNDMQNLTTENLGDSSGNIWNVETPFPTLKSNVPTKTYGVYTVSFAKNGGGAISQSETLTIKDGEVIKLDITPYEGNIVESVKLNGNIINGVSAGTQTLYISGISQNSTVDVTFSGAAFTVTSVYSDGKHSIEFEKEAESFNLYLYTGDSMPALPTATKITSGFDVTSYLTEATQYKAVVSVVENGSETLFSAPVIIDASFAKGLGTEDEPYEIRTIGHLKNIAKYPDKHFIQMADIDELLTEPLTPSDVNFSGVYDGNGKKLNINYNIRNGNTSTGLFSTVDGGVVKNLTVLGNMVCYGSNFGSIAGKISGKTSILNCVSEVKISVTNAGSVGGIIGSSTATDATIENCVNKGEISGYSYGLGGIIGNVNASTKINKCANFGDISDTRNVVGGIAGLCLTTVKNSYNTGNITGTTNAGGIIGHHSGGTVAENCYNLGSVTATDLTGRAAAFTTCNMAKTFAVKNCYNAGEIISSSKTQDLVAYTSTLGTVTYTACYQLTASGEESGINGVSYVTPETLKIATLGAGFEAADEKDVYPYPQIKGNLQETPWDFIKLTVSLNEGGASDFSGSKYIKQGANAILTLTPDDNKILEYIVYNGGVIALYENEEYTYMTPEMNSDSVIKIYFNEYKTQPEVTSVENPFIQKTDDGKNTAYVFATASGNIEGFERVNAGMLFSAANTSEAVFNLENSDIINIECVEEPNAIGQYGIMFKGSKLVSGTYYTRPYAIYEDKEGNIRIVYGKIVPFTVE